MAVKSSANITLGTEAVAPDTTNAPSSTALSKAVRLCLQFIRPSLRHGRAESGDTLPDQENTPG